MNKLNHVAFIMDGNGRWGLKYKKNRNLGHLEGIKIVKNIVKFALKNKISILTFYVFSSENWKRPLKEIKYLFSLIYNYFNKEIKNITSQGIKINIIGRKKKLPKKIQRILNVTSKKTRYNKKLTVNLAINYGSRNEIIDVVNKIKLKKISINEESINKNLFLKSPFPDVLIRTGGQKRLSNFMLWQLAYTELFFLDKLWPDFKEKDLKLIINKYKKIKRNYGAV